MKLEPFVTSCRSEVDRLFESLVHRTWRGAEESWSPALDAVEGEDFYRLEVDAPGVRASDLSITTQGRVLRIEGRRERAGRRPGERQFVVERVFGSFCRMLQLPHDVDRDRIRVRLADGVLTVEIPKTDARRHR